MKAIEPFCSRDLQDKRLKALRRVDSSGAVVHRHPIRMGCWWEALRHPYCSHACLRRERPVCGALI
jgi:hypothetical protein